MRATGMPFNHRMMGLQKFLDLFAGADCAVPSPRVSDAVCDHIKTEFGIFEMKIFILLPMRARMRGGIIPGVHHFIMRVGLGRGENF